MPRIEEFDKDTVLQQAMNVFWEKGYNGTSMQDLVDATGLNRSSIYNSFGSKLSLYQNTLKYYQKQTGGMFQKALLKANDPLEAIKMVFEGFLPEILGQDGGKGCFSMNCKAEMGHRDQDVQKWLLDTQENSLATFQGLVKEGQEQGIINSEQDSETYAYHIFNAFQGFRMTGILVKDKKVLQRIIDNALKTLR